MDDTNGPTLPNLDLSDIQRMLAEDRIQLEQFRIALSQEKQKVAFLTTQLETVKQQGTTNDSDNPSGN